MTHSALVRRVYLAVLAALLAVSLCTWLVFHALSRTAFLKLRAADLLPRAQSFASVAGRYIEGEYDDSWILSMVDVGENDSSLLNAYAVITDADGRKLLVSDRKGLPNEALIDEQIAHVLRNRSVLTVIESPFGTRYVVIGVPVWTHNRLAGTLILYMPEIDTMIARDTLTGALAVSMCITVPSVFLLMYFLAYKVVQPLRQMRDVALGMADGRFDLIADEDSRGEIGQLGASLNTLSRELKRNISALTFERNRLIQILNGLSEGIAAVDKSGAITHMNLSLERLFGIDTSTTDPRMRVIPFEQVWNAFHAAVENGTCWDEMIRSGDKDIRCIVSPVYDDSGTIAGAVGTFLDVSAEVMLENTRREYVANVSHEMRTPLTAMRGLIEPLRDGLVRDEATRQRYYEIILREVMRLSRLITDIMELSRLQSGTLSIESEPMDVREIVYDLAERYSSIAREHGLDLIVDDAVAELPEVYSNPDRIEQLLVILLDNAIKYTPQGSVRISCETHTGFVVIKVSDTGLGISKENQEHVFDRFYKVDKAHSGNGSGLGLSIAREVLSALGESIHLNSEPGKGSEFAFTIKRK